MTELQVAESALAEAIAVTSAFHEQLAKRTRAATAAGPGADEWQLVEAAGYQVEAAERREYAAHLQVKHLRAMAAAAAGALRRGN